MQQHRGSEANFYRSSAGAEIDQVQRLPGGDIWAIEIKRTTSPKVTRGFHIASEELGAAKRILVYANQEQVPGNGGHPGDAAQRCNEPPLRAPAGMQFRMPEPLKFRILIRQVFSADTALSASCSQINRQAAAREELVSTNWAESG